MVRQSLVSRLKVPLTFISEARDELKKVAWPSREVTTRYTIIIVVATVVVGMISGGFDYLLSLFVERLIL